MGFYQFKKEEEFNQSLDVLWDFISRPENLKKITPEEMGFEITSKDLPEKVYPGMIIVHKVSPLFGIKTTWVTEIKEVKEKEYFIDEQRLGPYKIWHHQHFLRATESGTIMSDIVSYQPPLGFLGDIVNSLIIEKKLNEVFKFRTEAINRIFA